MKIAIGISTLNDGIYNVDKIIKNIPSCYDVYVCHQISNNKKYVITDLEKNNLKIITKCDKGLSKSRNELIKASLIDGCDFLIISDDDVSFINDGLIDIRNYLINHNVNFNLWFNSVDESGVLRKKYPTKEKLLSVRDVFKVASIELCLNLKEIKNNISFDEGFGLGTSISCGEEPIFIYDCMKHGINTTYLPIKITQHPLDSSGCDFHENIKSFKNRKFVFERMFGKFYGYVYYILFVIKNHKKTKFSLLQLL